MQSLGSNAKAHFALMAVNLFYGINFVVVKEATPDYLSPFSLVGFRVLIGCLLFNLLYQFFYTEKVDKADIPRLIFCAFFGISANVAFLSKAYHLPALSMPR